MPEKTGTKAKKVLLIDWRPEVHKRFEDHQIQSDYEFKTCSSLDDALTFLNEKHADVDIIVAESFFNRGNVYEFLRALRRREEFACIPLLMLAVDTSEVGQICFESVGTSLKLMGAQDFIVVNDDLSSLLELIETTIKKENPLSMRI